MKKYKIKENPRAIPRPTSIEIKDAAAACSSKDVVLTSGSEILRIRAVAYEISNVLLFLSCIADRSVIFNNKSYFA